jgi:uncharacterized protein YecT (DUF1311 family)
MRRIVIGILCPIIGCLGSPEQGSEAYRRCVDKATTQAAMQACANEEAARADGELNRIYQKLLTAARGRSLAISKIKLAQEKWVAYRDAYIEAMYPEQNKQAAYGSRFPMDVDLLRLQMTLQQIEALNDLLRQYLDLGH